mgnify:CR=1 FL=1
MDLLAQYGTTGVAILAMMALARTLEHIVTKRRRNGSNGDWDGRERRASWHDLHDDIKAIRQSLDSIRDSLQALVTKVAVMDHRISDLERRTEHG